MSEPTTQRYGLPLLQPAQAQKHVTVNEALMRLDGLVNLVLQSTSAPTPPATATDGQCWGVPFGALGDWAGNAGRIAIRSNGGWVYADPQRGQQAFVRDLGATALWTGSQWASGAITLGALGAGLSAGVTEAEVDIVAGTAFWSGVFIPANTLVIGVTARVIQPITGTLTSWNIGISGAATRFGAGLGVEKNSWSQGLLTTPTAYYAATNLRLSATGGAFESGRVRLAIHWLEQRLPDAA